MNDKIKLDNVHSGSKKHKILVSVHVVVLVLLLIIITAFAMNRLAIVIKNPDQKITNNSFVCGADIINDFNKSNIVNSRDEFLTKLKSVAKNVESLADNESDPNCMFILFRYYYEFGDAKKARQYADKITDFNKQGRYLNGAINDFSGINRINEMVKSLEKGESNLDAG